VVLVLALGAGVWLQVQSRLGGDGKNPMFRSQERIELPADAFRHRPR
jgi:hypothetical protein